MYAIWDRLFRNVSLFGNLYPHTIVFKFITTFNKIKFVIISCRLTIVVLILESHLADSMSGSYKMKNKTFPTENNSTCWMRQKYTIVSECHPCSGKLCYKITT